MVRVMTKIDSLVVGSFNRKKEIELSQLLAPLGLKVASLAAFPGVVEVDETGDTFTANARLKAIGYAKQVGQWVLADDSGLAVNALKGEPGVNSAHYAGFKASDEANNRRLLEALKSVPTDRRTAHYVCHITLCDPQGTIVAEAEDVCRGRILEAEHGSEGFGYDPLFEIVEYHMTFGQLAPAVKACLSHRARAMRKIMFELERLVAGSG